MQCAATSGNILRAIKAELYFVATVHYIYM